MSSKNDPAAPNQSNTILQIVRNKNNLEDLMLKRRKNDFQKSLLVKIGDIEQERLDVFDFIKQLKLCDSDEMGEFKRLNEDLREKPRTTSKPGTAGFILPLISTKLTSASEAHADKNGPFTFNARTMQTAPASMLWKDPNMIRLKDMAAKNIGSGLEKKRNTQMIPEKCLQRLAVTGWADALLTLQAQNTQNEKQKRKARVRIPRDPDDDDEVDVDDDHIKGKERLELPPTGRLPRVSSELVIPEAVEAEIQRGVYTVRPSTTEKLRTKQKEVINNPKPKPRADNVNESETNVETQTEDTEKRSRRVVEAEEGIKKMRRRGRRGDHRPGSDVLRTILDRKAQKIIHKRCHKIPMATRIKTFYDKVQDTSSSPNKQTKIPTFLPPI